MSAEAYRPSPADGSLLDPHRLSERDFDALAAGADDLDVVRTLRASERSQRLILLRALIDEVRAHPDAMGPLAPVDDAWDLLVAADSADAVETAAVVDYPMTGAWAAYVLRRLRGLLHDDAPTWVDVGAVHAVAAAAALRSGVTFRTDLPVRRGTIVLPTVGCVRLPSRDPWETARLSVTQGTVRLTGNHGEVEVRAAAAGPGTLAWSRPAKVTSERDGLRLGVVLDDVDPYRHVVHTALPAPLPARDAARWQALFDGAWQLLVQHHPVRARAVMAVTRVAVPTARAERFRPRSASSGDVFGSVVLSRPDDAVQLAATLVHELQHAKLGALMHLVDLYDERSQQRFYAPWRDDPRPIGGLLQGIFAFFGVTGFWRRQRTVAAPAETVAAHFEFALWRQQVMRAIDDLVGSADLTALGRRFLLGTSTTLDGWLTEPVLPLARRLAQAACVDHYSGWRLHHLAPRPSTVASLARQWAAGGAASPTTVRATGVLTPDAAVSGLEARTVLARYLLSDRLALRELPRSDELGRQVRGAVQADLDWLAGDWRAATAGYEAILDADPANPHAWSGLGLAARDIGDSRAALGLAVRPELVRALHGRLTDDVAADDAAADDVRRRPPSRLAVARWLGRASTYGRVAVTCHARDGSRR